MVNNTLPETGIGQYADEVFRNIVRIDPKSVRLFTLADNRVGPLWISNILRNISLVRKIDPAGEATLYHFLNANLGLAVPSHRPCIVTLHDLIAANPGTNKQRLALSKGRDFILLAAMRFSVGFTRLADMVVCDSNSTLEDAVKYLGIDRARLRVIYLGVNHDVFRPRDKTLARKSLGLPISKKIILHVGVDEPRKNLATLFAAFTLNSKQFTDSILIRIGPESSNTRRLLTSLGIQNKVFHFRNPKEFPLYYNAADALAFPSTYEGFGLPPLEAMASGCPVVVSNVSSVPEVVGNAGIMLDPYDVEGFASALSELLSEPRIQLEQVESGITRSAMFSWKKCAAETYSAYQEFGNTPNRKYQHFHSSR